MSRFFRNLRTSILTTFSAMLFLSFTLVGVAFNLAVNQYIKSSAIAQLNDSSLSLVEILAQSMNEPEDTESLYPGTISANDPRRNIFRTNLNAFILDSQYRFVDQQRMPSDAQSIAEMLRSDKVNLAFLNNRRVRTADRIYYITAAKTTLVFEGDASVYMIYYVDVTDLTRFTTSVNMMLISLVGAIWMMSVVITSFLSGSIARPIRLLSMFAERIGKGDFSPNPISFRNIEFDILNHSLNHAAKQLAQYDNEQKTFFQNVSHELRTPLMAIKCYAEGIQYGLMEPSQASKTILAETDRLASMVDDLLYVSKIDNITTPHIHEIADLREIVKACINQQKAVADNRKVRFTLDMEDEPVLVSCALKHVTRAVNNLISNAIRYAHTTVHITCRRDGTAAFLAVEDDGPGIEPEREPFIFDRFYKGNGGQHGIGLSIVKSVVEQHKGTVTARNKSTSRDGDADQNELAETGAIFTIALPMG